MNEKFDESSVKNISLSSICNWGFGHIFPRLCKTHGPGAFKLDCLFHLLYGYCKLHLLSTENKTTIAIIAGTFQSHRFVHIRILISNKKIEIYSCSNVYSLILNCCKSFLVPIVGKFYWMIFQNKKQTVWMLLLCFYI